MQEMSLHTGIVVDIVEQKIKSLLAQYRRERIKVAEAKKSGSDADDIKVPKWFAYQRFKFLDGINKPRKTTKSKIISFTLIDFLLLVSCLDSLNPVIIANNSKYDALIFVKFRNPLPSSMLRFPSKVGTVSFLSKVFIHHLRLRFYLLASVLITINAALQIIRFSSELDIVAKNYSYSRVNVSRKNFGLNIECLSTLSTNTVQKHRLRTVFNQFCSQTLFANIVCLGLYPP
jgi:hypothetical protein